MYRVCVRAECLMRVALTLKQNAFYKPACSKRILTVGTLIGVWTCTNLPPLTFTLFAKNKLTVVADFSWHSFKAGHCFSVISIHMQWQGTLDLSFFLLLDFWAGFFVIFFLLLFCHRWSRTCSCSSFFFNLAQRWNTQLGQAWQLKDPDAKFQD